MCCLKLLLVTSFLVTSAPSDTEGFLLDSNLHIKQYSCNFEVSTCQYTPNPIVHGSAWLRHQIGPMTSLPTKDHTYNTTGKGHVMYIPPSSLARPGDKIILKSSVLDGLKGPVAVGFWYIISGGVSSIRLNVTVTDSVTGMPQTTIRTGQRLNYWTHGCLLANSASGNVTVTFEADYIYTSGYPAIALDDVIIESGTSCSRNVVTSSTASPPSVSQNGTYACTFETNLCIYSPKLSGSREHWAIQPIPPGSAPTNTDHTLGRPGTGHVIQITTRSPTGSKFVFGSTTLTDYKVGSYVTIEFWYKVPHSAMDLNLYIHGGSNPPSTPIFTRSGGILDEWTQACVTTSVRGPITLIFEAVVTHPYTSNTILVDDVTIQPGSKCASIVHTPNTTSISGSVSCDFESASLCGYTNIAHKPGSFDWLRHRGPTASAGTGPAVDHTTGRGYYMYIETSSPRARGDFALLESPQFVADGQQRLHFWYNTYGTSIGALKVYLEHITESGTILGPPLYQYSRAMTNDTIWKKGCFEIPKILGLTKVVFEGVVGNDFHGDIAIDDVILDSGSCNALPSEQWLAWGAWSSCSHTCGNATRERMRACSSFGCPGSRVQREECNYIYCEVSCDFESSSICGYHSLKDDFSWLWHKGMTQSTATGPNSDHTTGNGYYMYIESSSPRIPGDTASLQSPAFNPEGVQRLTFWYSAYGNNIGKLTVTQTDKTFLGLFPHSSELFAINTGTKSRDWQYACVDLPSSNSNSHIVFTGEVGTGYNGDLGIDDVILERGNCSALKTTPIPPTLVTSTNTSPSKSTIISTMTSALTSPASPTSTTSPPLTSSTQTTQVTQTKATSFTTNVSLQTTSVVGYWSHWYSDPCTVSCGTGTRTRVRHCSTGSDVHCGGTGMEIMPCNEGPCPVDGNWAEWSSFSVCSVTCGSGHMTSSRVCNNPTPQNNGLSCQGNSTRQSVCQQKSCIVNGKWSEWQTWTPCSVSCNSGTRSRDRSCDNPVPQNGGKSCIGDTTEVETCNDVTCPAWSHWFYEPCSTTCGNGTMLRIRHCSSGNDVDCGGVSNEKVFCNDGNCPVHGNWGAWSSYSACSVTCGDGNMTSTRTCDSPAPLHGGNDCPGDAVKNEPCHLAPCVVDGDWSVWTSWSSCTASCNTGSRSRSRTCDHPPPTHGGLDCKGSNNDTENCNVVKCPEWSEWFYGHCHVTCGSGNTTRIRHCSTGNDVDCGSGSSIETVGCDGGRCPVDGGWGTWQTWGVCSQTCGNGTRDRHRMCDNPAPQNGGKACSGLEIDTGECYMVECPYWLPFEQVSACSVTCGRGFASLKRNCSTGIQSDCPGSPYDEHACILNDCV